MILNVGPGSPTSKIRPCNNVTDSSQSTYLESIADSSTADDVITEATGAAETRNDQTTMKLAGVIDRWNYRTMYTGTTRLDRPPICAIGLRALVVRLSSAISSASRLDSV